MNAQETCEMVASNLETHARAMLAFGTGSSEMVTMLLRDAARLLAVSMTLTAAQFLLQISGNKSASVLEHLTRDLPEPPG